MAIYKSIFEIRGAIDDLVFYNLNGVPVVRKKSGFNKEAYKNNPKYERVRENSSEFGHCSKVGKMLRNSLHQYLSECGDKYMYQAFAKVMTQIKDLDAQSGRGKRRVEIGLKNENALPLLKHFKFGKIENLNSVAMREQGFFTIPIQLKNVDADEIILVTLKPDFTSYIAETKTQNLPAKNKQIVYDFEMQFADADNTSLLYFVVLKKNNEIVKMGFV